MKQFLPLHGGPRLLGRVNRLYPVRAVVLMALFFAMMTAATASATTFASVTVSPAQIIEGQDTTFTFEVTTPDPTRPIHIRYILPLKSAFFGRDYFLSGVLFVATIPPGATSTTVTLHSLVRDGIQPPRVAGLRIVHGKRYRIAFPDAASVQILDIESQAATAFSE